MGLPVELTGTGLLSVLCKKVKMVEIVNGEILTCSLTAGAKGGTELMADMMVKHIDKKHLEPFQIIHSRFRGFADDKIPVFVCHDLATDPEVAELANPEFRSKFAKIVMVSNFQKDQYHYCLGIPYDDMVVIPNAIEPIIGVGQRPDPNEEIRLIYHTTPHRGIELLAHVFPYLKEKYPQVTLDVYSSFKIYGWEQRDEQYQEVFEKLKTMNGVNYHGTVDNDTIREALLKSHIFAYPSIWMETSCIAAIEALCAGNAVVCPNYGALPETTKGFAHMVHYTEKYDLLAERFYHQMCNTIECVMKNSEYQNRPDTIMRSLFNMEYSWHNRKHEWESFLSGCLTKV
jgi:glycosyltransferase involved in cell wall biosynthesis